MALTKKKLLFALFSARFVVAFNIVFKDLASKLQAIWSSASAAIVNKSFGNFLLVSSRQKAK